MQIVQQRALEGSLENSERLKTESSVLTVTTPPREVQGVVGVGMLPICSDSSLPSICLSIYDCVFQRFASMRRQTFQLFPFTTRRVRQREESCKYGGGINSCYLQYWIILCSSNETGFFVLVIFLLVVYIRWAGLHISVCIIFCMYCTCCK